MQFARDNGVTKMRAVNDASKSCPTSCYCWKLLRNHVPLFAIIVYSSPKLCFFHMKVSDVMKLITDGSLVPVVPVKFNCWTSSEWTNFHKMY